jgi:hypothetical protein
MKCRVEPYKNKKERSLNTTLESVQDLLKDETLLEAKRIYFKIGEKR